MNKNYFNYLFLLFSAGLLLSCATNSNQHFASKSKHYKKSDRPVWAAKKFQYNPSETKYFDLKHTKLEVSFDWEKKQLIGHAELTLKPHFHPQNILVLDAKGFEIKTLTVEAKGETVNSSFTYDQKQLVVNLGTQYTRNDSLIVLIDYIAKPDELPKGGSQAITSDKGLYFINADGKDANKPKQIWTQGETEASSCWFPTIDAPNQKMTQELYITVENKYKTLSNGDFMYSTQNAGGTRTDYWKQDKPHAPYLCVMAIGEFAVVEDKWRDIPVNYYVEPAYERYARSIFGNTPEMLEFFSKKLGYDYAWDKYSQVIIRDYVSGAMENTSATTFMEAVQSTDRELLDRNWDDIISHELFHHWFGDLVTCESWSNLPLNESFATYGEYLWFEHKFGQDEADYHLQIDLSQYMEESKAKQEPLIRYYYNDREDMFDRHSYAKGGCVLHMLRKYLGDDAFFAGLSNYLKKNQFKAVEISHLRLAMEETSGEDLNWFFDQYFMSPGHVKLAVETKYTEGKLHIDAVQLQDTLYTPKYRMPLAIDVWVKDQKVRHKVWIEDLVQSFDFDVTDKPDLVLIDAEQQLVGEIIHDKTDEELVFQYAHAENYRTRYEAVSKLIGTKLDKASNRQMMFAALNDPFWFLRSAAIENFKAYKGTGKDTVEALVKALAMTDRKPSVKADAIGYLASLSNQGQYQDICLKGMNDSAYSVVGASLSAYLKLNKADASSLINKFEKEDNVEIVGALAKYYATKGDSSKFDWFVEKIDKGSGRELYYILTDFTKYAQKLNNAHKMKAVKVMEPIARTNTSFYAKFAAYKGISAFKELEGVAELREDIKAKEPNAKFKERFAQIP